MKKLLLLGLIGAMFISTMSGCGNKSNSSASSGGKKKIVVISKSFQNQFYQAAFKGAMDAGKKYNVDVTTNGPDAESNIPQQVDQVNGAINKKPDAIVLAACDPQSLNEALTKAKNNNIPVIGFDSGVPGDATGAVLATAATDNTNAGAFVAKNLFNSKEFQNKIKKGTTGNPAVIGILAQDSTSGSIVNRTNGFIKEMIKDLGTLDGLKGAVEVTGQEVWNKASSNPAKVKIAITVPPTTSQSDIQSAATTILKTPNMVALFAGNQGAVDGLVSATADGSALNKTTGKYKDLMVVGFDSGKAQKEAVKSGAFYGSVTQDPYTMGYDAIKLAVDAINKKSVKDVDTGEKWYDSKNVDTPDISKLLYD